MKDRFASLAATVPAFLAILLTLLCSVQADRVFWTLPANSTNIFAGCPVELGFRVQYSDLAMLQWVQLQVLAADNTVLIERLDNSTRESWDLKRAKNITWSVPQDWADGDYILRAFGNASYPCKENGRRVFCQFPLEDRETVHLQTLPEGQSCPKSLVPSSSSKVELPSISESVPSLSSTGSEEKGEGEYGFSTPLQIHIDPSVLALLQQQNEANAHHDSNVAVSLSGASVDSSKITLPTVSVVDPNQGRAQEKKITQASEAPRNVQASAFAIAGSILGLLVAW